MQQNSLQTFDKLKADIQVYVSQVKPVKIDSEETQKTVMETAKTIKGHLDRIELARVAAVKPHNEFVKQINGYAKEISDLLAKPGSMMKTSLLDWNQELEKRRREEQERIQKEADERRKLADQELKRAQQNAEFERAMNMTDQAEKTELVAANQAERANEQISKETKTEIRKTEAMKVKGVAKTWTFEVTDLAQVPREWLILDESKVRAAGVSTKGEAQIPGIRFFQKENIRL